MNLNEQPITIKKKANRSLGSILIDSGMLTPEGAEQILRLQKAEGLRFGEAAIQLGLLSDANLKFALSQQFDYSYLPPSGEKPVSEELIAAYQPFSSQVEKLRALRSQLKLRWFENNDQRALAIVGSNRQEGRSYISANLAIVFSQLGEKTLLIDADMRQPKQHELFKIDNRFGLSSLLGGHTDEDGIVPIKAFENLSILPAGALPPNPIELLNRPTFGKLLTYACQNYDVVLLDTPAASLSSDAQTIAQSALGALVLARKDETQLGGFLALTKNLKHMGIAVIGSVLNVPPLD